MNGKQKRLLIKITLSACLFLSGLFLPFDRYKIIPFAAAYIVVGYSVIIKAVRNITHGQVFDENFLMLTATVGAFILKEYPEAVAVMLFYQIGELFESIAVGKTRKSVSSLIDLTPEYANLLTDGGITQVDPEEVSVGDTVAVKTGERIPLDGIAVKGETSIDASALTGESMPVDIKEGDEVLSGCINLGAMIQVKVTKEFENSTVSRIMYLVEEASSRKAKTENFITRFARYYTPCVVGAAVLLALIPSIVTGNAGEWVSRALLFLVVSCPCALVVSVPLTFFCALGRASRQGILIKGSNFLELLSKADTAVFDKTGTLTKGKFGVCEISPNKTDENGLLEICAVAEKCVNHPIAMSVVSRYGKDIDTGRIDSAVEHTGFGVEAKADGRTIIVGNASMMEKFNVDFTPAETELTVLYAAVDGEYKGYITVADELKEKTPEAIGKLRRLGISETVMLTGDNKKTGEYIGRKAGIDKIFSSLLPDEKTQKLKEIKAQGKTVIYTGDGLNDAPVIAQADVGIAMGAMGSDAAIEAADIVIMDDDIDKLPAAIGIGRKAMKLVRENIIFALTVKFAIMALGVFGFANMWMAVFADVGVSILAILNALRVQNE